MAPKNLSFLYLLENSLLQNGHLNFCSSQIWSFYFILLAFPSSYTILLSSFSLHSCLEPSFPLNSAAYAIISGMWSPYLEVYASQSFTLLSMWVYQHGKCYGLFKNQHGNIATDVDIASEMPLIQKLGNHHFPAERRKRHFFLFITRKLLHYVHICF